MSGSGRLGHKQGEWGAEGVTRAGSDSRSLGLVCRKQDFCVYTAGWGTRGGPPCVYSGGVRGRRGRAIRETPPCSMWQGPGASPAGLRWTCWAHHLGLKWLFLWKASFGGG